ncbi:MAG TPA: hypothetical protein DIU07_07115 [Rhodobacteraceae bacterium]|nr:hypothetical protein [Paracoccaceae bacterium]
MTIRKIVFWSHLAVGVATGLVVLVLAVTGVLLTYEVQITRWAEQRAGIEATGPWLGAEALAAAALVETGGQVTALVFENDATAPVSATMGRRGKVLLDPYTGAALGNGDTGVGQFFHAVTSLHRWLSLTGSNGVGKAVTGAANLGFLFLALTGAYLWLPKVWRWARIKYLILFRRSYPSAQARDFHWHHIFGFWALIPLVLIIFTGVTMSYDRVQGMVMTLVGVGGEEEDDDRTGGGESDGTRQMTEAGVGLDAILNAAKAHDPAWRRVTLALPMTPGAQTVTAKVDTGPGRRETRKETLAISREDARIVEVQGFADQPKAARTFWFLRFAHTGEHYGLVGQTIAGLASLATAFMVYTGLALAWRRLVSPVLRRRRRPRGA